MPVWWVTDDVVVAVVVVVSEGLPSVTLIRMIQLSCWKILTTDIHTDLPRESNLKGSASQPSFFVSRNPKMIILVVESTPK